MRKPDERMPTELQQNSFGHALAVLSLLVCLTVNSRADYSDRRQIIVFATPESDSSQIIQRSVDALRCELVDRDTDVRYVDIIELSVVEAKSTSENRDEQSVLAQLMLLRGEEQSDFEIVLVGKDGGVKARSNDPGALRDFLALIDTMPMRRAEIRSRRKSDITCDSQD